MLLLPYLWACASSQNVAPVSSSEVQKFATTESGSTEPEKGEQQSSALRGVDKIVCASGHLERKRAALVNSDQEPTSELELEKAAVFLSFVRSEAVWTAKLQYGDLYSKENIIERTLLVSELVIEQEKVTWVGDFDNVMDRSATKSKEFFSLGTFTMNLEGGNGFYTGSGRFSAEENQAPVSCWVDDLEPRYRYSEGTCKNVEGVEGFNPWTLEMIRETQKGECADLAGEQLNENFMNYPNLPWDLRGANLSGADLVFANMIGGRFEGARMETLSLGYAKIEGTIDSHTRAPDFCQKREREEPATIFCSL